MTLPAPSALFSLPRSGFDSWYPGQAAAFSDVMTWLLSDDRFMGLSVPTGSGKSLVGVGASKLSGKRVVILTSTKGLQRQIIDDFGELGLVNIQGQNNYRCSLEEDRRVDEGPCHDGIGCPLKGTVCPYYLQLRKALSAQVVTTNYAYWLAQTTHSSGLGEVDLLVCDEAHLAFSALESFLQTRFARDEVESHGLRFFDGECEWDRWREWAQQGRPDIAGQAQELKEEIEQIALTGSGVPSALSRAYRNARVLERKLDVVARSRGRWLSERQRGGWLVRPVWVSQYAGYLFRGVEKVLLMSAVLSEKTLEALGIVHPHMHSSGSSFPVANTPIYHLPTVRVNYRSSDADLRIWSARIDQIIKRRLDRKGIVFTVSYARRDFLMQHSQYAGIMMSHATRDVVEMVGRFKASGPPRVLVSPAVTSGWNFPDDDCRYIVVGKLPYPDTQDAVMVARSEDDSDWTSFMAMETLIQECGRGTRSADDRCEVFVVDDGWRWYWPRYREFAPRWFQERVRRSLTTVPEPTV